MSRVTYFILQAHTGTGVSHRWQEKFGRGFGKNTGEWTRRLTLARKKSSAVSVVCVAIYWPTSGFYRTFMLCVLNRWDFNFCVRSSPLQGPKGVGGGDSTNVRQKRYFTVVVCGTSFTLLNFRSRFTTAWEWQSWVKLRPREKELHHLAS